MTSMKPSPLARCIAVVAVATLSLSSGCAEYVAINSAPQGAKAYVDGEFIGTTPAWTYIPRSQVGPNHTYEVSSSNCDPAEGTIPVYVASGRVVGYIFTVGLLALFKGPYYFSQVDVELQGGDCGARRSRGSGVEAPAVQVLQIVGDGNAPLSRAAPGSAQELEARLETLRGLYNRKLISEEEYERERNRAMKTFSEANR